MNEDVKIKWVKGLFIGTESVLSSIFGVLYIPVLLMVACNVLDYITGLIAAKYREDGGISSYKSMKGIFKKVSMWLLVVVGSIIDTLIKYSVNTFGWEWPLSFIVAAVVAVWIICNEIISILENITDIGVSVPRFLMPLVKNIKRKTEDVIPDQEEEE